MRKPKIDFDDPFSLYISLPHTPSPTLAHFIIDRARILTGGISIVKQEDESLGKVNKWIVCIFALWKAR